MVVRIITLEDHFATPMFQEMFPRGHVLAYNLAERGAYLGYDISAELLNLGDTRIAAMDASGIDVQVVSLTMPGCEGFEAESAITLARDANERLAAAIRAHPNRLAGFASLPTASPANAAKELERCVTKLGFKGAMINGHVRGEFLDNRKYWAIFECAQALNVPIYLHPTIPHPEVLKAYFEGYGELATPAWGFAMDTCTHFLRLVFAGLFDAYPNLKMILGHLGEGLPFWIHRLNDHTQFAAKRRGLKKTPAQYLRDNLLVTTSGNFFMPAFLCTLMALGADNILFSVDWPYESNRIATDWLNHLQIADQDKEKICHLNAERVLHV
jgi:predicted TIM-barrel fold metal-dependent hydrolase